MIKISFNSLGILNFNKAVVDEMSLIDITNNFTKGQFKKLDDFDFFESDLQFKMQLRFFLLRVYYLLVLF